MTNDTVPLDTVDAKTVSASSGRISDWQSFLNLSPLWYFQAHAALGIRPPTGTKRRDSEYEDRMDQQVAAFG